VLIKYPSVQKNPEALTLTEVSTVKLSEPAAIVTVPDEPWYPTEAYISDPIAIAVPGVTEMVVPVPVVLPLCAET
jgi:hypothetical protein